MPYRSKLENTHERMFVYQVWGLQDHSLGFRIAGNDPPVRIKWYGVLEERGVREAESHRAPSLVCRALHVAKVISPEAGKAMKESLVFVDGHFAGLR